MAPSPRGWYGTAGDRRASSLTNQAAVIRAAQRWGGKRRGRQGGRRADASPNFSQLKIKGLISTDHLGSSRSRPRLFSLLRRVPLPAGKHPLLYTWRF